MLELIAAKLTIMTFTITKMKIISIHVRMDNMVALPSLMKMEGTKSQELATIIKDYLLLHEIKITTKFLTEVSTVEPDRESRIYKIQENKNWTQKFSRKYALLVVPQI